MIGGLTSGNLREKRFRTFPAELRKDQRRFHADLDGIFD